MNTKNWFVKIVIVLALLSIVAACSPQSTSMSPQEIESMLTQKEQEKWDLFAKGDMTAASAFYADDFINVGFTPTGMVRQNKQEAFDMLAQVPPMPGGISLTDFLVVHGDGHSAIVSYKVAAPFGNLYVSSVWVERNGEWKTVFYQASPLQSMETVAPGNPMSPDQFPGRYVSTSPLDAVLFNPDGTYAIDAGSTGEYGTTGQFVIEGDHITFTDDDRAEVPSCTGDNRSGTYQFTFDGSTLTLTNVDDKCAGRSDYFIGKLWKK